MINLYLDDKRPAPKGWLLAKSYNEAVNIMRTYNVSQASLDHDLGEGQPTGYDFVVWMCKTGIWPFTKPQVHSMNPYGRSNMRALIDKCYPVR